MTLYLWIAFGSALGGVMLASHDRFPLALGWVAIWALASALRRRALADVIETAGGVIYVGAPCIAFLWLRAQPGHGQDFIISLFAIIWSVDVAAYFGGRLIGGPLLWPALSPRKTYSGTFSGMAAGTLAAIGLSYAFHAPAITWACLGFVLAACGLAGDLFESGLKRRFGVKDASRLIPGHGGVLDRLDGMILATSVASAILALAPSLGPALFGQAS